MMRVISISFVFSKQFRLALRVMPLQNQLAGSSKALDDGADRLGLEIGTSNLPRRSRHDLLAFEKPGFYQSLNTLLIDAACASCFVEADPLGVRQCSSLTWNRVIAPRRCYTILVPAHPLARGITKAV